MKRHFLFCILILPFWCAAVQPYTPVIADRVSEPWRWTQQGALDGLGVLCMDQAPDGTLWFGNTGSMASYDGHSVKVLDFEDEASLTSILSPGQTAWTVAIKGLSANRAIAFVNQSLIAWSDGEWTVIIPQVGEGAYTYCSIFQSSEGTIWVLQPHALWRVSSDFKHADVVLKPSVGASLETACLDASDSVWVIERKDAGRSHLIQLFLLEGSSELQQREHALPEHCSGFRSQLVSGVNGELWYVDRSGKAGLECFDIEQQKWRDRRAQTMPGVYHDLSVDGDGSVWGYASEQLIQASNQGDVAHSLNAPFRIANVSYQLFHDRDHRLWMMGRVGYVYSIDLGDDEWKTYPGLNFQCEDSDGIQWFIRWEASVVSHDPDTGEWKEYGVQDGVIDRVRNVFYSSHGLLWASGSHGSSAAVSTYNGTTWNRNEHPELSRWVGANSVMESSDGTVWFGAGSSSTGGAQFLGGALQYQVNLDHSVEVQKHHSSGGFPSTVTAFAETSDQTIWLGSQVFRCIDESSGELKKISGLKGEYCSDLTVDQEGDLWVAREHYGVCRRDEDAWTVYDVQDGIAGVDLSNLLVLQDGSMLAASGHGISRFDGESWLKFAYPTWFGMSIRASSMRESSDGAIWLNYSFYEDLSSRYKSYRAIRHVPETDPPETQIESWLEEVSAKGNSHISWSGSDVWGHTPADELQYSWRLDDGEWAAFSEELGFTFIELSSGDHTVEVRARDRAFNIDPTPARIEFTVLPPVWRQLWFISLISVLIGLIGLLVWIVFKNRERYLLRQQTERESFLVEQQNIREKNLIERQDEREEHLKELDRLKTGFFTNISHELRTPMTVISGRLETIFQSESNDKRKNALSVVLRNAQRVSNLVTQLLDFRKIEEGKMTVEATHGDLVSPLRNWVSSLEVLAEQKSISLSLESPDECRGGFDFDKVQKVITNLISNAIKYTNDGGDVRVVLAMIKSESEQPFVQVSVEDTGLGISQEHLAHIFDRFYRVSEASMAVGAGVGLNLSKELVDLMGGAIHAESPIHEDVERPGTRLSIELPMVQEGTAAEVLSAEEPVDQSDNSLESHPIHASGEDVPLILTVEDDQDIRDFIVEGLNVDYRVETAENGALGLQKAKELIPDLIITDVMMPVMDGVEMCRELKTSLETSHIPVVMLTAKTSLDSQVEGLKTGADDYVTKPFHMELLQVRVANLLESRRLLREKFCQDVPVLTPTVPENTPEKEFLDKAMTVLEGNYSEWEFNRDQFASAMHMSISSLNRKLKAITDRSSAEFIQEFRSMKAAEILASTSYSVTDIAFQVGCEDSSHFSRMFKKYYNMSPSAYRAEHGVADS